MPFSQATLQEQNLDKTMIRQREFSNVFRTLKNNKDTSTVGFVNKYHKRSQTWSNKITYLAGLVDGEGYLKIEKHGTIRLIIGMTDEKTIDWIYNKFGGTKTEQKTPKGKPFYVWRMNQGKDLFYLLLLLIPFLVTKKETLTNALKDLIDKFSIMEHTLKNFRKDLERR